MNNPQSTKPHPVRQPNRSLSYHPERLMSSSNVILSLSNYHPELFICHPEHSEGSRRPSRKQPYQQVISCQSVGASVLRHGWMCLQTLLANARDPANPLHLLLPTSPGRPPHPIRPRGRGQAQGQPLLFTKAPREPTEQDVHHPNK
jgi:hypothetical protein